ncbi:MAG: hypothetical protein D6761_01165 [Candidatus Dadabacteria bacterium]|nr:MAG: hypothetical protein D6761_01165 [Candidatus Dadabacteria bacterium]
MQWSRFCSNAAFVALAVSLPAAALAIDVGVDVQYRPRAEVSERSLAGATADQFVSHRARVGLSVSNGAWGLRLAPQHVLMWGSEASTLSGLSGNIDFHEAWGEWKKDGYRLRIGRQELIFDDHRLVGSVNWTQQARAFDAVRFDTSYPDSGLDTTLFAALVEENSPRNRAFWGLRTGLKKDALNGSVVVLAEHAETLANGDKDFWRLTPGVNVNWSSDGLSLALSGYVQAGKIAPGGATRETILAGMARLQAGYANDTLGKLTVNGEYLSGDDNAADTDRHTFDTLYATNHKFYGHMDYFLNIPKHTGNLGLIDAWMGYSRKLPKATSIYANIHEFLAAAESGAGNRDFGTEADLGMSWKVTSGVALKGGYSLYRSGDAFVDIGRASDSNEIGHWAWVMLNVAFSQTFSSN